MSDNQTTMRSMLNLLESVDQNKTTTQLNEGMYEAIEDIYPDPDTLADEALDAAAAYIQDKLGITTGDYAGHFFSGDNGLIITNILADYAMAEMNHMRDSEEESNLEEGSMKRWLEDRAENLEKSEFVANADEYGMKPEEAAKFWIAVNGEDEELDETQDPNLAKAYRLGNEAYKALKNEPERARAAQDKIYAEFPQYAKMWTMGYNDGERFDKQSIKETVSRKTFRQVADLIKQIPDVNKRKELADHHCEIFKQQNPRFSREKFMSYIGLADSALNESGGNTVQVTFVNSGYGITGEEQPQTVEKLGMDIDQSGRPILYIKSPSYGDKMRADWDAKNNRWIVDQD